MIGPVAIGGVGGSGTRVIAEIIRRVIMVRYHLADTRVMTFLCSAWKR